MGGWRLRWGERSWGGRGRRGGSGERMRRGWGGGMRRWGSLLAVHWCRSRPGRGGEDRMNEGVRDDQRSHRESPDGGGRGGSGGPQVGGAGGAGGRGGRGRSGTGRPPTRAGWAVRATQLAALKSAAGGKGRRQQKARRGGEEVARGRRGWEGAVGEGGRRGWAARLGQAGREGPWEAEGEAGWRGGAGGRLEGGWRRRKGGRMLKEAAGEGCDRWEVVGRGGTGRMVKNVNAAFLPRLQTP